MDWSTPHVLAAAAVVLALLVAFGYGDRRAASRDRAVMRDVAALLDDLWRPVRFLADLESVWPDLTEEQRREIQLSTPFREGFHEARAEERVREIKVLTRRIRAFRNWRLRAAIMQFLKDWRNQEPDELRVLIAMMKDEEGSASSGGSLREAE
jgi:hypothetical protein